MSNEMKTLKALTRKHAIEILEKIEENEVISSAEIVVESRVQPVQAYRVLSALEKARLVRREQKSADVRKPHVFWELTNKGRISKKWVDNFRRKLREVKE